MRNNRELTNYTESYNKGHRRKGGGREGRLSRQ